MLVRTGIWKLINRNHLVLLLDQKMTASQGAKSPVDKDDKAPIGAYGTLMNVSK